MLTVIYDYLLQVRKDVTSFDGVRYASMVRVVDCRTVQLPRFLVDDLGLMFSSKVLRTPQNTVHVSLRFPLLPSQSRLFFTISFHF